MIKVNKNIWRIQMKKDFDKIKIDFNIFNIPKKRFNGLFERPTQSLFTHLHVLGMMV